MLECGVAEEGEDGMGEFEARGLHGGVEEAGMHFCAYLAGFGGCELEG